MFKSTIVILFAVSQAWPQGSSNFLERVTETNRAHMQLAVVAVAKAHDRRLTALAKTLIDSYSSTPRINDRRLLTEEHQEMLDRLVAVSTGQFDREFIDVMANEYRRTIILFQQEAGIPTLHQRKFPRVSQPVPGEMAEVARAALPALERELAQVEQIRVSFLTVVNIDSSR